MLREKAVRERCRQGLDRDSGFISVPGLSPL